MLLRLTQHADTPPDWFRVEASLEDNGRRLETTTSRFQFALSAQDREDLRWYFEDYGENPFDPAPAIAARIEARIAEIGDLLFRAVFESSETARRLWARLSATSTPRASRSSPRSARRPPSPGSCCATR